MSKKIILFLVGVIFFSGFNLAHADVIINEVQLYPTGERFLELYNTGDEAIDLTGWYMQRKTTSGDFTTLVSNTNFEGKEIGAHNYFIISRASFDNSNIVLSTLTLTESNTIQIKKSQEEIIDKIGWGGASDCDNPCPSNPGEGQSIQKSSSSSWVTATPTPGKVNEVSSTPPIDDSGNSGESSSVGNSSSSTSSASTTTDTKTKTTTVKKIKAEITANTLGYAGIPLSFQGMAFGLEGGQLFHGRYFWNFGDGDSREVKVINTDKFTHTYFYPGEYTVLLEYYPDFFADVPDASQKIIVKVMAPGVSISGIGNTQDFFVELSNDNSYDVDISKWIISSDAKSFKIPPNTIIGSKKKMIISSKLTNFSIADKNTLKLMTSEGDLVFDYSASILFPIVAIPTKIIAKTTVQPKTSTSQGSGAIEMLEDEPASLSLGGSASAIGSDVIKDNYYLPILISVVFIGVSASVVYFIRRKKVAFSVGDDFKILDE